MSTAMFLAEARVIAGSRGRWSRPRGSAEAAPMQAVAPERTPAVLGWVTFPGRRGEPTEAILDGRGVWSCPRLPVLDRVLNALYAPEADERGDLGPAARVQLDRVARWLRGTARLADGSVV